MSDLLTRIEEFKIPEDLEHLVLVQVEKDKTLPTQTKNKLTRVERGCHYRLLCPFPAQLVGAPRGQNAVHLKHVVILQKEHAFFCHLNDKRRVFVRRSSSDILETPRNV